MTTKSPLTTETAPPNSFVIPEKKVAYVSVTKAACTSVRWMIADLSGEDRETFLNGTGATQTQLMTIHGGRERWQKTPTLRQLDEDALRHVTPDEGWFVFALVRNPWSRLWSAWQSKFLVQHAFYQRTYADASFYPRLPMTPDDVIEDFRSFAIAKPWQTDPVLRTDAHFRTQAKALAFHRVPYSRVYDVHEMPDLLADLHRHLAEQGADQELYVPRANETPLAPVRAAFDDEVDSAVRSAYRQDLDLFPGRWSADQLKYVDTWSDDALANIRAQVAANERIGALSVRAREVQAELHETQQELARANARLRRLDPLLRGPLGAGARGVRSLVRRVAGQR